jgi:hypothetical protein
VNRRPPSSLRFRGALPDSRTWHLRPLY